MPKYLFLLFTCLILSISVYGQYPKAKKISLPNSSLSNFYQIDSSVYRSEQPDNKDFKALEKYGIREVLNLRNRHNDNDEAKGTSLKLHRLRTKAHSISEQELVEALLIIKNRKGPIVVHCLHGSDRTGAVIAMYRIVFQGMSKDDAITELKDGGFGYHRIYRNIIKTINEADIAQIRKKLNINP